MVDRLALAADYLLHGLAEKQVPLVALGLSEGDDRLNVPITLTPEGETVAHTI